MWQNILKVLQPGKYGLNQNITLKSVLSMTRESRLSLGKQESWHPFFVRTYKKLGVNFEINFFKGMLF